MIKVIDVAYPILQVPSLNKQEAVGRAYNLEVAKVLLYDGKTYMDVEIYGDGSQISDMVYVADVAKALVNAMLKAHNGEVFKVPVEVGPEVNSTVQKVAELIISLSGSQSKIVNLPMRPGEIAGAVVKADTSTLKLVDIDPKDLVSLPVGMQLTIDYFKEYLDGYSTDK